MRRIFQIEQCFPRRPRPVAAMRLDRDVPVRIRDGAHLMANVFRPAGDGRYPVIMSGARLYSCVIHCPGSFALMKKVGS